MKQKICKEMHWSNDPINHTFAPPPPPPPGPFGDPAHPGHGPAFPPPNPYTAAWYYAYRPWIDPKSIGTAVPGMNYGLYHPDGPLVVGDAFNYGSTIVGVSTKAVISLEVTINYDDSTKDKTIEINVGDVDTFRYIEDGQIKTCTGKVVNIWKVYEADNTNNYYKLKIDCSTDYSSTSVIIKNDQIRGVSKFVPHADEDTTIDNSEHKFGTTVGSITKATITDATVDTNGNIIEGNIIKGVVDGYTLDGIATGTNSSGTDIIVTNGKTYGGTITNGKIISGVVRSGSVDGILDDETNITSKATITNAILEAVVIINTTVSGGKTSDGKFITQELNGFVYNATITGDDVVTTGGITEGNITTGGTTTGGIATGGTATGIIDGKSYSIEGGITKPEAGKKLITTGAVVVGGTITGGIKSGNVIIGAVVTGGVVTKGTTVNGVTTGGTLVPGITNPIPIAKIDFQNDERSNLAREINVDRKGNPRWPNNDDLLLLKDRVTGEFSTNLGVATMGRIDDIGDINDK